MWTFVFSVCDISIQFLVAVVFGFVVFCLWCLMMEPRSNLKGSSSVSES